jgi:hypothetical protein
MILEVIGRARRRLLWNAIALEGARAACLCLGLLVLLLLLGTDILDWRYLLFIPAATMVGGACLTWRRIPSADEAARMLDRRLGLQDAIATALFFGPGHTARKVDEGMRQAQLAQTLPLVAAIDLGKTLPLRMPRLIYAGAALAVIGGGLVGLRYSVKGWLDLRAPATPAIALLIQNVTAEVANLQQWLNPMTPEIKGNDHPTEQAELNAKDTSQSNPNSNNPGDTSRSNEPGVEKQDSKMASDDPPDGQTEASGEEESARDGDSPQQSDHTGRRGEQRQRDQRSSANQDASGPGAESSVFNKVRDTVANLLSAVKPQSGGRGGNRAEFDRNSPKQDGQSGRGEDQDGTASASEGQDRGDGSPGRKDGSTSSAQANGTGADKQSSSGAGGDEGNKEMRLADQRAAMGKISVILGKRAKDVTGTASAEVISGEQALQTRYESRQVKHSGVEDNGERDVVPIELQAYVRQYLQAARSGTSRGETPALKQK